MPTEQVRWLLERIERVVQRAENTSLQIVDGQRVMAEVTPDELRYWVAQMRAGLALREASDNARRADLG